MGAADRTDAEVDELMDVSAKKRAEVDALWAKLNGGGGSNDASAAASKAPAKGGRGRGGKKAATTTTDDDSHSGPGPSKGRAALDVRVFSRYRQPHMPHPREIELSSTLLAVMTPPL